ncbi:hypothetical protein EUX98_g5570 [Antrodiella citrinella]|uniref:Alpha/beta hydrolase fold-3 domain-containing protein n=1 Tax=Antrodiella citrinella TaxID=2447956 RepID=A0A4S4MR38_9APHY|nr:hypothetical protein EUX98_g5570 [Antrodiella citrinella]
MPTHIAILEGLNIKGVWVAPTPHLIVGDVKRWAKKAHVESIRIPGYWMEPEGSNRETGEAPRPGERVVYHLHGGGYTHHTAHPTGATANIPRGIMQHSDSVLRAFNLEYRLSKGPPSTNPFPTALLDAIAGYNYLVNHVKFKPEDIIVEGDSAGGNLAIALVRYLLENQSQTESPEVTIPPPPGELILCSPWADIGDSDVKPGSSIYTNRSVDYLDMVKPSVRTNKLKFLGPFEFAGANSNRYISPGSTASTMEPVSFKGFPRTFITAGDAEVLVDQIRTLRERMVADMASKDDEKVAELLKEYQRRNITNKHTVSHLLLAEHGIEMSGSTIVRRRRELGLKGSGRTTREMSENEKRQLLMDQLAKDPGRTRGPRTIKEAIAHETSVHLTREWITQEMRRIDPVGFAIRNPHNRRVDVEEALPQGPHFAWTGYGALTPSSGMPMQGTTVDRKEASLTYALTHALREALTSEPAGEEPTVDRFLRRIDNIRAERGTAHLQFDWGDSMLATWEEGKAFYNPADPRQYELAQWLWSTLIQKELDNSRYTYNNHKSRKDNAKSRPTGITPSIALALYVQHGGENCLQNVDTEIIGHLMDDVGGDDVVRFVTKAYERRAMVVFEALGVREVKVTNVWDVFSQMLPLI